MGLCLFYDRRGQFTHDVAEWELRVDRFRVFYNVEQDVQIVSIEVIGFKRGNQLFVRGIRRIL